MVGWGRGEGGEERVGSGGETSGELGLLVSHRAREGTSRPATGAPSAVCLCAGLVLVVDEWSWRRWCVRVGRPTCCGAGTAEWVEEALASINMTSLLPAVSCLCVHPSWSASICRSVCLFAHSACWSVSLICLCVHLVCLSVCLSVFDLSVSWPVFIYLHLPSL